MNETEKEAWQAFQGVVKSYIGFEVTAMLDQAKSLNISKSNDVTKKLPGFLNSAPKHT